MTAIQLGCPGARVVHAGGPTALFMRTGSYFANVPEALLLRALQGQMARYWGMPAGLGWGGTKAKQPEAQSAYENTLGLVLELMAGADVIFGAGLLDSVQQMSLEELVIADETFGMVTRLLRGVDGRARDLGRRPHQEARLPRRLPVRAAHARARARAVAGAPRRDRHLRQLEERRQPASGRQGAGRRRRHPRLPAPEFPAELGREFDDIIAAVESGRF